MHVSHPSTAVVPSLDGEVLIVLAGSTAPMTGRQVAMLAHRGSQSAIAATLDRLVTQGLVVRQEIGRSYLHTLNREHIAAPIVGLLKGLWGELLDRIRRELATWSIPPAHASLFGSAARGDGDVASDIDLLLVCPEGVDADGDEWWDQIHRLSESVHAWTGNHAGPISLSAARFAALRTDPPPIVADLRRDGIDLAGVPLHEAFAGAPWPDDTTSRGQDADLRPSRRARASA